MDRNDYLRAAAAQGAIWGRKAADFLEKCMTNSRCSTQASRVQNYNKVRDAGIAGVQAKDTSPYIETDAAAAWRAAAMAEIIPRLKSASQRQVQGSNEPWCPDYAQDPSTWPNAPLGWMNNL